MPTKHAWMVRAGNDNVLADQTFEKNAVAIGWGQLGDVKDLTTRKQFRDRYRQSIPTDSEKRAQVNADQVYRFVHEIEPTDYVLTYIKASREILIGVAENDCEYAPQVFGEEYPYVRHVKWEKRVSRDVFSEAARNSMGSTLTVFNLNDYIEEISKVVASKSPVPAVMTDVEPEPPLFDDWESRSNELISDLVSKLDPHDFQDLVAAVLRAMGFRAKSVPPGPDRGVDILAHTDSFGFVQPRIKVQVKHQQGTAGGPDMRNFVSTLQPGDNGLFVSMGGFTKDARIEASYRSITLLDRDEFIELMLEHYENLAPEFKAKIPLRRLWVPTI